MLSEENVKYYKLFIVLFPILFYIPKFFEVRTEYVDHSKYREVDCSKIMPTAYILNHPEQYPSVKFELTEEERNSIINLSMKCKVILLKVLILILRLRLFFGAFSKNSGG